MPEAKAHAHKMVAEVAKAAAHELYDTMMEDNLLFKEWKRQNPGASPKALQSRFVAKHWGKCLPFARATLALQLRSSTDEVLKESIYEALLLDNTLVKGRGTPQTMRQLGVEE